MLTETCRVWGVAVNMMLTNSVQLEQLQLFSESFPQALGMCLWKFLNILTEGHSWDHTLMLDEKTWLTVSALIPKRFCGFEVRTLRCPVKLFDTKLAHACLYGPAFVPTAFEFIWRLRDFWRSVVIDSTEDRWPLHTMHVSIRWTCSVIFTWPTNILCYNTTRSWLQSS